MERIRKILPTAGSFLCGILLLCNFVRAQTFYSTDEKYVLTKGRDNPFIHPFFPEYPDSTISDMHRLFPVNFLGNIGLPSPAYRLRYGTDDIGFRLYKPPYNNDRMTVQDVKYYRTKGPYADLEGVAGPNYFQSFRALYSQQFAKRLNVSIKFDRYSSEGFYVRQIAFVNHLAFTSNYESKSGRSGFYLYFLNNSNRHQENGGITNILLNDSTMLLPKRTLTTRLTGAARDNRENYLSFEPWFRLNKIDSLHAGHFIRFRMAASTEAYKYVDAQDGASKFYNNYYLDTVATRDSSNVRKASGEAAYAFVSKSQRWKADAGYRYEINRTWQYSDSVFANQYLLATSSFSQKDARDSTWNRNNFLSSLSAQYIFAGNNGGNFKIETKNQYFINLRKKQSLAFRMLYERRNPDYMDVQWVSNHFRYHSEKNNVSQFQATASWSIWKGLQLEGTLQQIQNFIYFDQQALPQQYSKAVTNLSSTLRFRNVFFGHLGIEVIETFQSTSTPNIVRLPQQITSGGLFFYGNLFRRVLQLQVGLQGTIYSQFRPYDYMPANQAFYLQDSYRTTSYPYVDFYLSARIRPVSIFLKIQNAMQGNAGSQYSFARGYYQPDFSFWYGIRWMFFD